MNTRRWYKPEQCALEVQPVWYVSDGLKLFFGNGRSDVRWFNVQGYIIQDVLLFEGSKIIGDE